MGDIFYWVVNMSIVGTIVGGVVMLIGAVRRVPRRVSCTLWIIPFLRWWLPVGISGPFSLMSLLLLLNGRSVMVYDGEAVDFGMTNAVSAASSYFPITYRVLGLETVFSVAGVIWAAGVSVLLLLLAVRYRRTTAAVCDIQPFSDKVFLSDKVSAPAVYGVIHPKIVLPTDWPQDDWHYIHAHETAHIRRHDNLRRLLAFVTAAVHWFNPFAWMFLRSYLTQIELACDEAVLSACAPEEKKAYAHSLLSAAEQRNALTSPFGGAKLRTRLTHILSYRKLSVFGGICCLLFSAAVAYVLLINAA